jgi:hypothetical protein
MVMETKPKRPNNYASQALIVIYVAGYFAAWPSDLDRSFARYMMAAGWPYYMAYVEVEAYFVRRDRAHFTAEPY